MIFSFEISFDSPSFVISTYEVDSLTFSDTMVALRIMRAQFPHIDKVSIQPFILHSQLYSSVKDRTQVDRELESMRREKVLRVFKLNTGQDDHAIMFLDDYLTQQSTFQVDRVVKRMEEKKQRNLEVFEWFKAHVIDNKQDPSIDDQELISYRALVMYVCVRDMSSQFCNPLKQRLLLSHGGKVKDEHISLLINAGLLVSSNGINGTVVALPIDISWTVSSNLPGGKREGGLDDWTRQLIDPNMYWFAIPNIGSILKGLSQGRKELLSLLNRQRYKEMMLAPLEKKRLRLSLLDMRFHLRDLIGSGHLKTVNTPTGLLVRVSKD
ncbi:hypothetical protein POTOM_019976 [Populus tomentosa]|uniref:Serine/threonine-protein kinase 19 n=1 Tax=Populus tomentosa TaxID=118781 RepID=A0A8X8D3J7_POPTO|nr:hypothetical protein POTOM_019976 [Populus tomentosa]